MCSDKVSHFLWIWKIKTLLIFCFLVLSRKIWKLKKILTFCQVIHMAKMENKHCKEKCEISKLREKKKIKHWNVKSEYLYKNLVKGCQFMSSEELSLLNLKKNSTSFFGPLPWIYFHTEYRQILKVHSPVWGTHRNIKMKKERNEGERKKEGQGAWSFSLLT